jgi:tetratricopeptide (TPR) repeat protein
LVSLKQYKKTISFYRKALKFAPTTVTAEAISSIYYTIITIELIFLSQYKKAIKDCNKRINIEKNKFLTYQVQ